MHNITYLDSWFANIYIFGGKWMFWLILILLPLSLTKSYIKMVYGVISNDIDNDAFISGWFSFLKDYLPIIGIIVLIAIIKAIFY